MRILCVSTYFLPYTSGLTIYPYRLFKYLTAKGHGVQVVTFRHLNTLLSKETIGGIDIERINYWFKISKGFFAPFFVFSLLKYMRNTDVVVINQPSVEGIGAVIIARLLRKKTISLYYCQLQSNVSFFQKMIDCVVNNIVLIELMLSNLIVTTNADYIKKTFINILRHKITVIMPPIIHHPVLPDKYADYMRQKARRVWIGFCGRISSEKGLEYLLETYEEIQTKISSAMLVFAGPTGGEVAGEKNYYQKIKKMLEDKNIPHHFFGHLNDNGMGAFYKALDCLVLPSINSTEAFGMVQVEAMFQGTPVVASDLPGVRMPVRLTGMGLVVEPKNAHKLAQAIIHVIKYRAQFTNKKKSLHTQKIFALSHFFEKWDCLLQQIETQNSLKA